MPRPIIIDTDPGTDDAVAILLALAAPELEVLGLVAVAGNLPPDMAAGVAELVVMGGASHALGNMTPAAEFNIHADPLAAALVFDSAVPITLIPLDLTHQVPATQERIERIRALGNHCGLAAAEL